MKNITNILSKCLSTYDVVILKRDDILKKSDKNVSWAKRHTILSNKDLRYWYDLAHAQKTPDMPLGIIPLKSIYSIVPLNEGAIGGKQFPFQISASNWVKKSQLNGERKFSFAAATDDVKHYKIFLS